jgi:outer membrane immunogenic protein
MLKTLLGTNGSADKVGDTAMKRIFLGAIGLLALGAAPAVAADLPARAYTKAPPMIAAIYDWSGFYLGVDGGGGSSHKCWTNTSTAALGPTVPNASEACHDATGGLVGGQVGYRWQMSNWVFGVEAQGDWANFKGSNASVFAPGVTNQTKVDAVGLFTGQVGYAWNNVLWYVKGGAAVTNDNYNGITTATGIALDQAKETRWGGTVGTGVEVSFAQNWSVGVEYDHLFMGNRTLTFTTLPAGAFSRTDNIKQDADMGSVRVNYRWGGPVVAKY